MTIMFDCGMHLAYQDRRRFPDFRYVTSDGNYTENLDCVIISHFHLDHVGALPLFTEDCGYSGPIITTHPTKAISAVLLEDYRFGSEIRPLLVILTCDRKMTASSLGEDRIYSSADIQSCLKKVSTVVGREAKLTPLNRFKQLASMKRLRSRVDLVYL